MTRGRGGDEREGVSAHWLMIFGLAFIIGFTMMAHGIVTNDQNHKDG